MTATTTTTAAFNGKVWNLAAEVLESQTRQFIADVWEGDYATEADENAQSAAAIAVQELEKVAQNATNWICNGFEEDCFDDEEAEDAVTKAKRAADDAEEAAQQAEDAENYARAAALDFQRFTLVNIDSQLTAITTKARNARANAGKARDYANAAEELLRQVIDTIKTRRRENA